MDAGNSLYYGWVHKRNPRTFARTDAQGKTMLVTADGRSTASLGLSLKEEADVATSLGMVQAINLDGCGSTTAVAWGLIKGFEPLTGGQSEAYSRPSDVSWPFV